MFLGFICLAEQFFGAVHEVYFTSTISLSVCLFAGFGGCKRLLIGQITLVSCLI